MGNCFSNDAGVAKNREIEARNRADWIKEQNVVKLLLLGTGESGKSTFFKQMRIINAEGFPKSERISLKPSIQASIIDNMQVLLEGSMDHFPAKDSELVSKFLSIDKDSGLSSNVVDMIKILWADPGVQQAWSKRSQYQVADSLPYFVQHLDRIAASDYQPDTQDILRVRIRTSGIVEKKFRINNVDFAVFDVGGQRNERKKWIHCFDSVTAVLFFAALSEYDQVLYEDNLMNRMDEAVILFENICNSKFFRRTAMILFLNKTDLFTEKLAKVPFRVDGADGRFEDFEGPFVVPGTASAQPGTKEFEQCYNATIQYLRKMFVARNKTPGKDVYIHETCATDTENVDRVFSSCRDIILRRNLDAHGFSTKTPEMA